MTDSTEGCRLTEQQRTDICAVLGMGCSRATAVKRVGCLETDLYDEIGRDPKFAAEMRQAESDYELLHMKNVYQAAKDPKNWRVSVWALEHVLPERYARRDPGRVNVNQLVAIMEKMSDVLVEEVPDESIREKIRKRIENLVEDMRRGRPRKEF